MKGLKYVFASAVAGGVGYGLSRMGLGPLSFDAPYAPQILAGAGVAMPFLWWLLSSLPKQDPHVQYFSAIHLLHRLQERKPQPTTMHWLQKLLCLSPVAAVAFAAAEPNLDGVRFAGGNGPVVVAVDNGWTSAVDWKGRQALLDSILERAETAGRRVVLLPAISAAEQSGGVPDAEVDASRARSSAQEIKPYAWPVDRAAQIEDLKKLSFQPDAPASVFWLSDGVETPGTRDFFDALKRLGTVSVYRDDNTKTPYLLSQKENTGEKMTIIVKRLRSGPARTVRLTASDEAGRPLLQQDAAFQSGEIETQVVFDIPADLRKQLARVTVDGDRTSGSTLLLDENWRQRSVGLIRKGQPRRLQDGAYFIEEAVKPFTDLHIGSVEEMMRRSLSVIIVTDETILVGNERAALKDWIAKGGILLRFAGPKLAAQPDDDLVPVPLFEGQTDMEGDLSGGGDSRLADFSQGTPLYGIKIPEDVKIKTLVLPEPGPGVGEATWGSLKDGKPFITAKKEGTGWIVLIHTTANLDWSNIPLYGNFYMQTMRAIVSHSQGVASKDHLNESLPPIAVLNAQGTLEPAPRGVLPLTQDVLTARRMDMRHPPGYYGNEAARMAINVADAGAFSAMPDFGPEIAVQTYDRASDQEDYGAWLLAAALVLIGADIATRLRQNSASGWSVGGRRRERSGLTLQQELPKGRDIQ